MSGKGPTNLRIYVPSPSLLIGGHLTPRDDLCPHAERSGDTSNTDSGTDSTQTETSNTEDWATLVDGHESGVGPSLD